MEISFFDLGRVHIKLQNRKLPTNMEAARKSCESEYLDNRFFL